MLDIIGALFVGAIATADAIILIGLARIRSSTRIAAYVIAALTTALLIAIATMGGFATGAAGPVPGPVLAFLILTIAGLTAWFASPAFREAFLSVPQAALVAVNVFRVGGIFFLILHSQGRLASPFAISAGWGDIITGAIALPLAVAAASNRKVPRALLIAWNAFGILDLIDAIVLGALSAPTPFRVFTESPGTLSMGDLPWVVIPALLVPVYLMTHLAIAVQLRSGMKRAVPQQTEQLPRRAA